MKKIVLDAGHGLTTSGKQTPKGIKGWTLNDTVCRYTAEYLSGYDAEVTRSDNTTGKTDIDLSVRTKYINSTNPDIMISIHHNANTGTFGTWTGVEVFYNEGKPKRDVDLAKLFADEISKQTGLKNRGAKSDLHSPPKTLHMVRETKSTIPSVLCEGGFMDSTIDEPVITSEKGQRAYAQAVANVCISYLSLQKKTPSAVKLYRIQLGAYGNKSNADDALAKIKAEGLKDAYVIPLGADSLYRIQLGAFQQKANADSYLMYVQKAGYKDAFIR